MKKLLCAVSLLLFVNTASALYSIHGTLAICVGSTGLLTDSTSGGTWSCGNLSVASVSGSTGLVTGLSTGTAIITYTDALSSFVTATITINATPASISGVRYACVGSTSTLTDSTSAGTWSSGNTGVATIGSTTGIVTAISAGTSTITYKISSTGCYVSSIFTANPLPSSIIGNASLCLGLSSTLSNSLSGGTWTSNSTSIATVGSLTGVVSGVALGTTAITYQISATGCKITRNVTVNPLPANLSGLTNVCAESTIILSDATVGGIWSSSNTGIATVDGSGSVTGISAGVVNITYTLPTSCYKTIALTVNPIPSALSGDSITCIGVSVDLSTTTSGGVWVSHDSSIATVDNTGLVVGVTGGAVAISYVLPTGCYIDKIISVHTDSLHLGTFSICDPTTTAYIYDPVTGLPWDTYVVTHGVGVYFSSFTYGNGGGCEVDYVVSLHPLPGNITGTLFLCVGLTTPLADVPSGGSWSSSNTSVATISSAGLVSGLASGTTTITYMLPTGCFKTKVVTVNPLPSSITGIPTVCVGLTTALTDTSSGGTWSSSNPSIGMVSATGVVTGMAGGTCRITYTLPTGCLTSVVVTVNQLPSSISGVTTVCAGFTTSLSDSISSGTWSSSSTTIATISGTGVVSGISAGTTIITYTLPTGCIMTITYTVNPQPNAGTISGPTNVCVGSVSMSDVSPGGIWSSTNLAVATISTSGLLAALSQGVDTIKYTVTNICGTAVAIKIITVNPLPAIISGPTSICIGASVLLSDSTAGGTWSSNNTAVASIGSGGLLAGISAGTAKISYTLSTGCFQSLLITVNSLPTTTPTNNSPICVGGTLNLISSGLPAGSLSYIWNGPSGFSSTSATPLLPGAGLGASGVYTITVSITSTGCSATATTSVTVNPAPTTTPTSNSPICTGANINLSSGASASGVPSYSWIGPSGYSSTLANPSLSGVTTANSGVYTLTVSTAGSGCVATSTTNVLVNTTGVTASNSSPACVGGTVSLFSTPLGSATPTGYFWTGPSGYTSTLPNPSIVGVTTAMAGAYSVTMSTSGSGCVATSTTVVQVKTIALAASNSSPACVGGTVSLFSTPSGTATPFTYSWSGPLSFNSTSQNPTPLTSITSAISGVYTVTVTSSGSGCIAVNTTSVIVNTIGISANNSSPACSGAAINLISTPVGTISPATYFWSGPMSYSSTIQNPSLTSSATAGMSGVYTVTVQASGSNCVAIATTNVLVNTLGVTATNSSPACVGGTVNITSTSTGAITPSAYFWNGPLGYSASTQTSALVGITTSMAGSYTVTVTGAGCTASATTLVTVIPTPTTTPLTNSPICVGGTINLSASATGVGTITYLWNGPLGYASTLASPIRIAATAAMAGIYTITLTTPGSGCFAAGAVNVIVNPSPTTSATNNSPACIGGTVNLDAHGLGATTYSWTGPSGYTSTIATPALIGGALVSGAYSVIVSTPGSGCIASSITIVTINPTPTTAATNSSPACVGGTVNLDAHSTGATTYLWTGPAGYTSTAAAPVLNGAALTPGVYTVTVNGAGFGCAATSATNVTVNPTPSVAPTNTSPACAGGTVSLDGHGVGGTTYLWTGPGGYTTTASTPTLSGGTLLSGTYTVTTSAPGSGCTGAGTTTVTVNPLPANITGTPSVCVGALILLSDVTPGGVWSSANTSIALISSIGLVSGISTGSTTITYLLPTGCSQTILVTVNILPNSGLISGPNAVCVGGQIILTDGAVGGSWSSVNSSVATISTAGVVTGTNAGVDSIRYTVINGCGTAVSYQVITVNPLPSNILGATNVCEGASITLSDIAPGGVWSSSNTSIAIISSSGVVTGGVAGTANITYVISTGCIQVIPLTVNVLPFSGAIIGTSSVCVGNSITLTNSTPGGSWSSLNNTLATVSSFGVVSSIAVGTDTIAYSVTNGCGIAVTQKAITINPLPASITGVLTVCIGGTTVLSDTSTGGSWSSSNSAIALISTPGIVTGISTGLANILYTSTFGCVKTTIITVNPLPTSINGQSSVCLGYSIALSNLSPGGSWSSSNNAVATIGTGGIVTGASAGTANITYTLPTGCFVTKVITVNTLPTAISGSTMVCQGLTIAMGDAISGGTWSSSATSVCTIGLSSGLATGVASGTANITYTLSSGCTTIKAITVNPLPMAITGTSNLCYGLSSTLTDLTIGGNWLSSNSSIMSVGSSTGIITGVATGTAVITYMLSTGCSTTNIVTVNPLPPSILGSNVICQGASTHLTDLVLGGTWSSSNASISTVGSLTGLVTGLSSGTAMITYVLPTGCIISQTLTVNPLPAVIAGPYGLCLGSSASMSDLTSGGTWSSSNNTIASIGSGGVVTGMSIGTAIIAYNLPTGCSSVKTLSINALPGPINGISDICLGSTTVLTDSSLGGTWTTTNPSVATINSSGLVYGVAEGTDTIIYSIGTGCSVAISFIVNPLPEKLYGPHTVCVGSSINLTDSLGNIVYTVTGVIPGITYVTLSTLSGCSTTVAITINPLPAAITGVTGLCFGTTSLLHDATIGGIWSSSNIAIVSINDTGLIYGHSVGTATLTYTALTGCFRTVVASVNYLGMISGLTSTNPTSCSGAEGTINLYGLSATTSYVVSYLKNGIPFSTTKTSNSSGTILLNAMSAGIYTNICVAIGGCTSNYVTVTLTDPALPAITGILSVCVGSNTSLSNPILGGVWSSSSSSIANVGPSTGLVAGVSAGTASLTYTITSGCIIATTVTVNPLPSPITGTLSVCRDMSITLTNSTAGGYWTGGAIGVASVTTTGIVNAIAPGTASINYILPTSCRATAMITVNPLPSMISGSRNVCIGSNITVTDTIAAGIWSSSNNAVATIGSLSGLISGIATGTSIVTYTLPTGCITTTVITVNPLPLSISGNQTVCVGFTTTLTDLTAGGNWTSSNGNLIINAATGVVTGLAGGTSTISYTSVAGCLTTIVVTINTAPNSIQGNLTVCQGLTSTLSDSTIGGTWSSSNANVTINMITGILNGANVGTAVITYISGTGCSAVATITVVAIPSVISGFLNVCVGSTITLSDTPIGGIWSSANSNITIGSSTGLVTGVSSGTSAVTYTNAIGCTRSGIVTVNPLPLSINGNSSACVGSYTTLSDLSAAGSWTSTGSSGTLTSAGTSAVVTGISSGTLSVTFTLPTGCYTTRIITINPLPAAISGSDNTCVGSISNLSDLATGGIWAVNPLTAGIASIGSSSGNLLGLSPGAVIISYTLPTGCSVQTSITVNPLPSSITGAAGVCKGSIILLTDLTSGGTWSSSDIAVAGIDIASGIVTGNNTGVATITYKLPTGCYSSLLVTVNPLPSSINANMSICLGSSTLLTDSIGGGTWIISGTPGSATINVLSGVIAALALGTVNVTYTLPTGCIATRSFTVSPAPAPVTGPSSVCQGNNIALSDATPGGTWASENISIAVVGTVTGVLTGISGGLVSISYTAPTGCVVTAPVLVNPIAPIQGENHVCASYFINLSDSITGGNWISTTDSVATISLSGGVVAGVHSGVTIISYILSTGCFATMGVTVNGLPPSYYIMGGGTYCAGGIGVHVGLNGSDSGVSYQLYNSSSFVVSLPGSGSALDFGIFSATGLYNVLAVNDITGCTNYMATPVTVSMSTIIVPSVSISAALGSTMCTGTADTFIATPVNGGTSPFYQWYVNGSSTGVGPTFSYIPLVGDSISVKMISSATCAIPDSASTFTSITTSITGLMPSVSISASPGDSLCAGTSVTITPAPVNAGPTPTYIWRKNGILSGSGPTFTFLPADGDNIFCIMHGSLPCQLAPYVNSDNNINMTIPGILVPAISIEAHPGLNISWGTSDTLVADVVANGGISLAYQWSINGSPITGATTNTFISNTLANRDTVSCAVTELSVCGIATRMEKVIIINTAGLGTAITAVDFNELRLTPNPSNGSFSIKGFIGTEIYEDIDIDISDILGQIVYRKNISPQKGLINEQIKLSSNIANGIYLINVHSRTAKKVFHIVIEK